MRYLTPILLAAASVCVGQAQPDAGLTLTAQKSNVSGRDRDGSDDRSNRDYERGRRALDKREWDAAIAQFTEVAAAGRSNADAALYWKAFALGKLGRQAEASATLDSIAKLHPQSRWLNDAKALQAEIAQAAGRPVSPENANDDELKLMALNGLMQSDPERSIPLLEKLLERRMSPQLQERALFVLSQSDSARAREIVTRVAKGGSNPELQLKAVRSLGIYGSKANREALASIYGSSSDVAVKQAVLHSFMVSGERDRILQAAKSDANPELRKSAIHWLGTMGAGTQLAEMYSSESDADTRMHILRALFISGNSGKIIDLAKTEKDPKLRLRAIDHLGTMRSADTAAALMSLYTADVATDVRKAVLRALFVQGSAQQLVDLGRKETNPELRKTIVQHLSNMRSKEATEFLMELLK